MAIPKGLSNEEFRRRFFQEYPDFFAGGDGGAVSQAKIDSLPKSVRRDDTFRSLLQSGNLLPVGEGPSIEDLFLSRLNAIAGHGSSKGKAQVPQEFLDSFNEFQDVVREFQGNLRQSRQTLGDFAKGVREGSILPFTTSEDQRTRLIDRAQGDLSRILERSQADQFSQLARRGLLPSSQTGFSGPAASILSQTRAETFEDPLTSFIRDLDIQSEADFVANRNRLRELGVNVDQFVAGLDNTGAQTAGQFALGAGNLGLGIGNLQLGNLNSQRNYINSLLGQLNAFDQTAFQRDAFERDQRLQSEAIFQAQQAAKKADKNTFGNFLGGPGGQILGSLVGSIGGPIGAIGGAAISNKLFPNTFSNIFPGSGGSGGSGGSLPPINIPAENPLKDFSAQLNPNLRLPTFGQAASLF